MDAKFLAGALCATGFFIQAQEQPKLTQPHPREDIMWTVAYSYHVTNAKLPRILLIGDSICNGYQSDVCKELEGTAAVSFWASSKCACDKSYLRELALYLDEYDYKVIHFNNGLHSLGSNLADWENCLRAAIRLIKEKSRGAKIFWASSTPLKDSKLTARVKQQNEIALRIMKEEGIPMDDLFALMDPLDRETYWSDTFHYKEPAKVMQAKQIAGLVREALKK